MDILEAIQTRYSCRQFLPDKVKEEDLRALLEAWRLAPSAHNNQPCEVYVIDESAALEKIKRSRKGWFDEPCVLLLTYKKMKVGGAASTITIRVPLM